MNSLVWSVVLAAVMLGVGWLTVYWLIRRGAREYRREQEKLQKIGSLSMSDAATKALRIMSDTTLFRCVENPTTSGESLEALAPELRKIFEIYESIESRGGSHAIVSRPLIGPSAIKAHFLRIGSIAEGTDVEGEVGVVPGDETVYELYSGEAPDPRFGTYKSIYHWILAIAEEA